MHQQEVMINRVRYRITFDESGTISSVKNVLDDKELQPMDKVFQIVNRSAAKIFFKAWVDGVRYL